LQAHGYQGVWIQVRITIQTFVWKYMRRFISVSCTFFTEKALGAHECTKICQNLTDRLKPKVRWFWCKCD